MRFKTVTAAVAAAMGMLASAGAAAQQTGNSASKWGPYIDLEGNLGSKRHIGEGNLFVPVAQDDKSLYFFNARARLDDESDREGSLGLGMRRMLASGWNLGTYGFVDRRRTSLNSSFNQATLGFEALGRDFDWRANVYRPFGGNSTQLSNNSTGSISGGSLFVSTTIREERALPGYDLEMGWRLPIFEAESSRQARIFLAGYRFSDSGIQVQGGRVRAEYALAEFEGAWKGVQLTLGAEFQSDNARNGQGFVGARLRIPLGAKSTATRLNVQERRMLAPIRRDVDIVSQARARTLAPEVATATASGQNIVAVSSADTGGAALPGAVAAAGANSTVLLSGTFNTSATTQLQPGQTMIGAGTLDVRTASGRTATVTLPGATINMQTSAAMGIVTTLSMANNSTVKGMSILQQDPGGANTMGIRANGVTNVNILNNTVWVTASGPAGAFGVRVELGATANVGNNVITVVHPNSNASALQIFDASAKAYGNTLSATGLTAGHSRAVSLVPVGSNVEIQAGSTGNIMQAGSCDVNLAGATVVGSMSFVDGSSCP